MPTTVTGNAAAFDIVDILNADAVLPVNGDLVDASVVDVAGQRIVDFIASVGTQIVTREVPKRLRGYDTVASLKAYGAMADGDVMMIRQPTYTGGATGIASGVALFVYDSASTAPETTVPGIADAYLVVEPASGTGRWFNLCTSPGWQVGSAPRFQPRGLKRSGVEKITSSSSGFNTVTDTTGWMDLGIVLELPDALSRLQTEVSLHCSVSVRSGSMADGFDFRLEYSINGGAWSAVPGSTRTVGGVAGTNSAWIPITISAFDLIETELPLRYRLAADFPDSSTLDVARNFTLMAAWHWDGV